MGFSEPVSSSIEREPLEEIALEDISSSDEGNEGAIIVSVEEDASIEEIEDKVRKEIVARSWWLKEKWIEKGIPKEQITVEINGSRMELYNFSDRLEDRHIEDLTSVLEDFATIENGDITREKVKYVLIDDERLVNPQTGGEMNGYSSAEEKAIKLYPRALEDVPHRVESASNFEGTLIHELGHRVDTKFANAWQQRFNWTQLDIPEALPGGAHKYYSVEDASRCPTEYAQINHNEDICESLVAALRDKDNLDPERLEALQEGLFGDSDQDQSIEDQSTILIKRKTGEEIELPRHGKVKYKKQKQKRIKLKLG